MVVNAVALLLLTANPSPAVAAPKTLLFLGNGALTNSTIPSYTTQFLSTSRDGNTYNFFTKTAPFLDDFLRQKPVMDEIRMQSWDYIFVSGLRKGNTPKDRKARGEATDLIRILQQHSNRVYILPEWPTKDPYQAQFLQELYDAYGTASGAPVLQTAYFWHRMHRVRPDVEIWSKDGVLPNELGSYLYASGIYKSITSNDKEVPHWNPGRVSKEHAHLVFFQVEQARKGSVVW